MQEILVEIQEIKQLLQVIANNLEQKNDINIEQISNELAQSFKSSTLLNTL